MHGGAIGVKDAIDLEATFVRATLPEHVKKIPFGRSDQAPEVVAQYEAGPPDTVIFGTRSGIINERYHESRTGEIMSEAETMLWLGYILGDFESGSYSRQEYEELKALLPPVDDDLTAVVVAIV